MGISCSLKMGSDFPLLSKAELVSRGQSAWDRLMCAGPLLPVASLCCVKPLLAFFFSTTGRGSHCQVVFQRNRMSWATNLIKKSKKEKNKIVRKSEEVEWEKHPHCLPCWTFCPVLSWLRQTASVRASTCRTELVLFFTWSIQDV